jgi:periplasmic protein CpxP/Spy
MLKKMRAVVNARLRPSFSTCRPSARLLTESGDIRMNILASRFALLALALSAAGLAPVAFAQDSAPSGSSSTQSKGPQHAAPDPQKQAARLTKRLGLSDDQTSKITTLLQNQQQQLTAARNDSSLSPQDRRAKLRSIRQNTDSQINTVLTPAQQTQYANMKQQMKERMQNAHNGGSSSGGSSSSNNSDSSN